MELTKNAVIDGGEIFIKAEGLGCICTGILGIGGMEYYNNGTVVTATPASLTIDEEDQNGVAFSCENLYSFNMGNAQA